MAKIKATKAAIAPAPPSKGAKYAYAAKLKKQK